MVVAQAACQAEILGSSLAVVLLRHDMVQRVRQDGQFLR
jgi:hypothetical protein